MSHNKIPGFPLRALKRTRRLRVLDLNQNNIVELKGSLSFLVSLEIITISNNKISCIQPNFFSRMSLRKLDLSYNYISRLDPSIFDKHVLGSLLYLDIRWNNLDCYCYIWNKFYLWFVSHDSETTRLPGFFPECTIEIDKYFDGCVSCQTPRGLRGRSVSRYGYNTSCDLQKNLLNTVVFTALFTLFLLCGCIGYSKWLKRLIFRKVNEYFRVQSLKIGSIFSSQKTCTNEKAFVFFDHNNDELGDWVDNKLVPGMINGNPSIELLLTGRDIDAGMSSTENVFQLVTKSRKTILILSGCFCNTSICKFMISALQELQYSSGRDQLILLEWHGEVAARVPELIQRTFNRKFYNFLKFDYTNDDEVMFFETLRTAFASRARVLED
ncbi:toll-like receptor 2 type-2 [Clavelina lepadiformis]|uniref:toll-like receptor 2 type-2 n=1 Tax=Clavelina lepadiformis TaxID=159417 RepID=UPI004041118D